MGLGDKATDIALALIPPHDSDPERIYRWRLTLAGVVVLMAGTISAHIALACGFLPVFFPGFANASDVQALNVQQTAMRQESLESALYNMQRDKCLALSGGNMQAALVQDQRIREKMAVYRQISHGQNYDLPPCDLFVTH
jgi:hypothetical protein